MKRILVPVAALIAVLAAWFVVPGTSRAETEHAAAPASAPASAPADGPPKAAPGAVPPHGPGVAAPDEEEDAELHQMPDRTGEKQKLGLVITAINKIDPVRSV